MLDKLWKIAPAPTGIAHSGGMKLDPAALSFLDLPGELRNNVYYLLLEFPDPIRVGLNNVSGGMGLFRLLGDRNVDLAKAQGSRKRQINLTIDSFDNVSTATRLRRDRTSPSCLLDSYLSDLGLFRTSRAIYIEAVSVFYRVNTFVITHQDHLVCIEPSRCYRSRDICHSDTRDSLHNSRGWHIANSARWLQHLGSQMALLHKIVIDLDNLCPMTCGPLISWYASPNDLDVSGLVKLLWSRNTPLDISFSRGDDGLSDYPDRQRLRARTFQLDNKFQCNATELTKSLQSLLQKDSNIRKYACLIGSVYLRRCGHFAVICYKTNGATCMVRHNQSTYHTCADTLTVLWRDGSEWNECCKPRTLLGLPQCLKRRIFSEVIGPKTHIEIDVNKPWSHLGPAAGLRLVNRESMALFNEIYWVGKSFHLRCTLEGSQTSFEFQALRRWLGSNGDPHTIEGLLVGAKSSRITRALQITLVFHVWEYVYIEEVRMSIMPLILATAHLPNKFEHGEEIEVKFCVERKGGAIERTLSLPRLRSRVYIALYNIFKRATYPSLILNRPCPEILVDGWGKVVEYVAYGSKPTSYIRNPDEEDRHGPAHKRFSKALREIGLGDSFPYEGYMKSFVRYLEMALREDKPQEAAEKYLKSG